MIDVSDFEEVFEFDPRVKLSSNRVKEVSRNRSKHLLFFDLLLDELHLGNLTKLYPPHDNKGLRELHHAIVESNVTTTQKQSLVYYLLRDIQTPEDEADRFANACYLPRQYVTAMHGFWEMDRHEYRPAMDHLTQPSLLPTFAPEILLQLMRYSKDLELPLAYYHAKSPPLALKSEVRTEYFKHLACMNVQQAFFATRGQPDAHELFDTIVEMVLMEPEDDRRADAGMVLLDLPLTSEEEDWMEQYLKGKGSKHPGSTDTLIMRKIAMGKRAEVAGTEGRLRGYKLDGLDWHILTSNMGKATARKTS